MWKKMDEKEKDFIIFSVQKKNVLLVFPFAFVISILTYGFGYSKYIGNLNIK